MSAKFSVAALPMDDFELPVRKDRDGNPAVYDPSELAFMARGACRLEDPDLFLTGTNKGKTSLRGSVVIAGVTMRKSAQIERARSICRACPVLAECGLFVFRYPEDEGVWAATIPEERE